MEQLDALLTKIQSEGVETAQREAKKIVEAAKAEAQKVVSEAQAKAEAMKVAAEADAARTMAGAEATMRQAARDIVIKLEQDIDALLTRTLGGEVVTAMETPEVVETLIQEAVDTYLKTGEVCVVVGPELIAGLRAKLAAQPSVKVITDEQTGAGFKVRLAGGRVEHDFTAEAVTDALSAFLRPQLAKLLKA